MCTVVLLIRPGHAWPVLLAANRDERLDRAWEPPAAHWPEQPGVVAGRDRTGGGTWMGVNRAGVAAAVLNRQGTLGPAPGKHSRGELPLIALAQDSAADAAKAVGALDAGLWRSFNMVLADRHGAFFVRGLGHGRPEAWALAPGVHMVTAHDPDDMDSLRVARHLPRFRAAEPPGPGDWGAWREILSDRSGAAGEQINVPPRAGYGTASSALLALPAEGPPRWLFAAGAPDEAPFEPVPLP
ncbi:MAG: NRDE family protein [Alphaproteobacteria bacterium]|nr:NRDE family protein [Alphaproteobacteria bacterium]